MFNKTILVLLAGSLVFASCKSDDESDINPGGPTVPQDYSGIVINEICGAQTPDDDWVELYNKGDKDVQIDGMSFVKTDEDGLSEVIYTVPKSTTLKAGEYKVVATLSGELQAGISNKKEVAIDLQSPDGKSVDKFDRDVNIGKDKKHEEDGSYARIPDGTGEWTISTKATRGAANEKGEDVQKPEDQNYDGLVLNEICGLQSPDDDWVEVYNSSSKDMVIDGVYIIKTDEDGISETIYTVPTGTTLKAGEYKVIATLSGELQAGISNKKELALQLTTPSGKSIDKFDRDANIGKDKKHEEGGSYARIPNGNGGWAITTNATRGAAND